MTDNKCRANSVWNLLYYAGIWSNLEILEIRSTHDLTIVSTDKRREGGHSYQVNCRQFTSMHRTWQNDKPTRAPTMWVMKLGFERIWMTEEEGQQVAAAIHETHSPVAID